MALSVCAVQHSTLICFLILAPSFVLYENVFYLCLSRVSFDLPIKIGKRNHCPSFILMFLFHLLLYVGVYSIELFLRHVGVYCIELFLRHVTINAFATLPLVVGCVTGGIVDGPKNK